MTCPFLEEIVMVYCEAFPVRKLVPKHQITTESLCMGEGYKTCPFFKEITARLESASLKMAEVIEGEPHREGP